MMNTGEYGSSEYVNAGQVSEYRLDGKVFTMATLDRLVTHTAVREFVALTK
jgi:hypothetical protein